ncbi:hypothetical protein LHU53_15545 [Rhodoferax sp. U2-2l]|uniref:phage head spike fiber domain-containing protein n=1 Tax=Rhodoferax sp. U2-2l TaxID=2884000 RepID=UPI001D0B4DC2|nr:hypothetical protein [Rhodoferax sp. U2-2l]MCB8748314.1 hypothetical protein [Rhodoferax sp. U2-2l]
MTLPTLSPAPATTPNIYGGDPTAFDADMQAWLAWQKKRSTEDPEFLAWIEANALAIAASAAAAAVSEGNAAASQASALVSANLAASATGAAKWVSGTTYAVGVVVWSPANSRTYRRTVAGSGTTDPSLDPTNWSILTLEIDTGHPLVRPTLILDFANSQMVDPRITFTRVSTATRVNSKGLIEVVPSGVPRIDYDPVTGECKGLLTEVARTNLALQSQTFDNASWGKANATISANAAAAPDGTLTAYKLVEASGLLNQEISQAITLLLGVSYALSVYAKAGERQILRMAGRSAGAWVTFPNARFNLLSGGITTASGDKAPTMEAVGDGWYRCTIFGTLEVSGSAGMIIAPQIDSVNSSIYTGDGTSGIYIWGAQLEAGAFPTSYIPTVATAVTRAADVAVMTGANFSSWYRKSEFSALFKFKGESSGTQTLGVFNNATTDEQIKLESVAGALVLTVTTGGVLQATLALGTVTNGAAYTVAATWKDNDIAASVNGATPVTASGASLPTPTQLVIGSNARIRGYPKRVSNAQLQALSA